MKKGSYKGVCGNPQCKRDFTVNVPWQKYCSDRCRLIAWALNKVKSLCEKKA